MSEDSLHGGTHCGDTAQWVPRRLAGTHPRGWVWPGVLGVPSQALDLFADFQLRTLELRERQTCDARGKRQAYLARVDQVAGGSLGAE